MPFSISDEARMLRDNAGRYFAGAGTLAALRHGRAAHDLDRLARGVWPGMIELGLAGILVPEQFGGTGLGFSASIHISEMMGRSLAAGPFVSTAVMAATALCHGDNVALKASLLPRIVKGEVIVSAAEETVRHAPLDIKATARTAGDSYKISGRKIAVADGNIATTFIVAARLEDHSGTLGLFIVDAARPGVRMSAGLGIDSRPSVTLELKDVAVTTADQVCAPTQWDGPPPCSSACMMPSRLHLAAEMLGLAQEAFDRTLEYLKTRVQFGRKIGEFQALQHRAALLFGELEVARSVVLKAGAESRSDEGSFAEYVSLAKARVGETAKHVTTEAVQLHGGIGVTDEFDIGLYLKRARAASEQLGDWAFHAERYAQIQGL